MSPFQKKMEELKQRPNPSAQRAGWALDQANQSLKVTIEKLQERLDRLNRQPSKAAGANR